MADKIFGEYSDELMIGPQDLPNLRWAIGPDAASELMWDDWGDADVPHLAIFAGTKAGKSTILNTMLLQLLYNNTPDQLRLVLAEPKTGLGSFKNVRAVDKFIGMQEKAPPGTEPRLAKQRPSIFLGRLAHTLDQEIEEMFRRNELFETLGVKHIGAGINNISTSWEVGLKYNEPDLLVPLRIVIIEEAIMGLQKPRKGVSPEGAEWHDLVMSALDAIAVAGRSAGIHLLMIAQDATKANFPGLIKKNSRRLGLKLGTTAASISAIEQIGLEKLPGKGHGLYESSDYGWVRLRGLFPDEVTVGKWLERIDQDPGVDKSAPLLQLEEDEEFMDIGDLQDLGWG